MKFDVFNWSEVETTKSFPVKAGRLKLRLSQPGAVYAASEGYEVLLAYAAEIDLQTSQTLEVRIDAPAGTRAFIEDPMPANHSTAAEEVYTNADRMPIESGSVLDVKKALRLFQLEQKGLVEAMRKERKALEAKTKQTATTTETTATPEPLATTETTNEPAQ